ncbi:MAG: L,D-transpeptidase family protein [Ramlibacter sp.]|nr:L,D-transpeptidase family protein [Ramlibacter sp.]
MGKAGVGKTVEGDQRTPLGLYFITSSLDPKSLKDLYGSGALPINYPNAFDVRRGKTGSGIWLHGTPSSQFSRAPLATDGCIAVANPDLDRIIRTVEIRTTPVLIDKNLTWVTDQSLAAERKAFEALLRSWAVAKSAGEHARLLTYYAADFSADGRTWLLTHRRSKRILRAPRDVLFNSTTFRFSVLLAKLRSWWRRLARSSLAQGRVEPSASTGNGVARNGKFSMKGLCEPGATCESGLPCGYARDLRATSGPSQLVICM